MTRPKGLTTGPKKARKVMPAVAPEVMRDAPEGTIWEVRQGTGSVNLSGAVMNVPLGDLPEDRHVRIHELLHARVTPEDLLVVGMEQGASHDALQGCEDGRLGRVAQCQGIDAYTQTSPITEAQARELFARLLGTEDRPLPIGVDPDYHQAGCLAVAANGTALEWVASQAIDAIPDRVMRKCVGGIVAECKALLSPTNPLTTIDAARVLDQLLPDPEEGEGEQVGKGSPDAMTGKVHDGQGPKTEQGCECDPEAVKVIRPPLTIRGTSSRVSNRRRSPDSGALTRATECMSPLGDGRPFTRRRKAEGGVVVIDVSGSMHPDHEQVKALVQAAPGCMIVTYSSREEGGKTLVYVVGDKGRIVAPDQLIIGGANRNDASVLAWADKHGPRGPRVWVSDGQAGNRTGTITPGSIAFTRRMAKRMGYVQVRTLTEALA